MATTVELTIISDLFQVEAENILNDALNIFHKFVAKYSRFIDTSEVSRLNKSQGKFVAVSPELFEIIKLGYELFEVTNGVFDITLIDILEAYGYDANLDFTKLDNPVLSYEIAELVKNRPSMNLIEFDDEKYRIKLVPNQRIDLGGLGKGFAIRTVRDFLLNKKIDDFLINAGGDVYAHGNKLGQPWKIGLFDPESTLENNKFETFGEIEISNEAVASSGPHARRFKTFHHLINPKNGHPSDNQKISFVKSPDPVIADAFATICYLNPEIDERILKRYQVEKLDKNP